MGMAMGVRALGARSKCYTRGLCCAAVAALSTALSAFAATPASAPDLRSTSPAGGWSSSPFAPIKGSSPNRASALANSSKPP